MSNSKTSNYLNNKLVRDGATLIAITQSRIFKPKNKLPKLLYEK